MLGETQGMGSIFLCSNLNPSVFTNTAKFEIIAWISISYYIHRFLLGSITHPYHIMNGGLA